MKRGSDGQIVANMDNTARESKTLCTIFSLTSENFRSKVLEPDWVGDAAGFVETVHV
jgi:hypothetical protein